MNMRETSTQHHQFIVTGREGIEGGIMVRQPYIVISIRDPGKRRARIPKTLGLVDVLYLAFHDAEPIKAFELPAHIRVMTRKQATKIWQFVDRYRVEVSTIVCHCEQGMSRSPAVAAGIAETWGQSSKEIWADAQPNRFVYDLVREVGKSRNAFNP